MGIALVLIIVLVYLVIWRVGSVMLQLTGLDGRTASFQALSALTQTGFTTREAERVVSHDQRRKIVSFLIISGHAGFATVVALLVQSLVSKDPFELAWRVGALAVLGVLIYYLAASRGINQRFTGLIRRHLERTSSARPLACEEMLHLAEGYGIAEVHLGARQRQAVHGKTLAQLSLTAHGILVLAIQRSDGTLVPAPTSSSTFEPGATLICYGRIDSIRHLAQHPDDFLRAKATRARRRSPPQPKPSESPSPDSGL